jgi:hypothetical protein
MVTSAEDNGYAGQGPVLLDIGGDIGALIVTMPSRLDGTEIEIRPVGAGDHPVGDAHGRAHHHWPHVGVVGRPIGNRIVHSAVFGELTEGEYELYVRPHGPVQLQARVLGAQVTEAIWPR